MLYSNDRAGPRDGKRTAILKARKVPNDMKKTWLIALALTLVLTACGGKGDPSSAAPSRPTESAPSSQTPAAEPLAAPPSQPTADWAPGELPQFAPPEPGTPIVTLHTSLGDVRMMLFPQAAPLTVENFVTHCESGYYDGKIFHRVIQDFMAQGGADERGGRSIWGVEFDDEFSPNLHNFRGAVSMANAGISTNGSQFFIMQSGPDAPNAITAPLADAVMMTWLENKLLQEGTLKLWEKAGTAGDQAELDAYVDQLNAEANERLSAGLTDADRAAWQPAVDKYLEMGGAPSLDYKHTVFGQVLEGMDVVDAMVSVETTNDKPNEDIVIESVTVEYAQ